MDVTPFRDLAVASVALIVVLYLLRALLKGVFVLVNNMVDISQSALDNNTAALRDNSEATRELRAFLHAELVQQRIDNEARADKAVAFIIKRIDALEKRDA